MPQVPYQPIPTERPNQALDYQRVQANPDAFGAGVGRATQQLGGQIKQSSEAVYRAAADFQKRQDETDVDAVYSNVFSPAFRDMYQQYYSLQGKGAVDAMPDFIKKMQELQQETTQALPSDRQKHLFNSMSRKRVEMELDGMARFADTQNKVYKQETFKSTLDNMQLDAADKHNDEVAFGRVLGGMRFTIDKYATENGKSSEWARDKIAEAESAAAVSRVQRQIVDDPEAAQKWYAKNQSMINPKERALLEHQLKAAVMPLEIKQTADRIMGPDADTAIKRSLSGDAPFPAQSNAPRYTATDEATALQMAKDLQGQPFAIDVVPEGPRLARDTRAMLGTWVTAAEKEFPNDAVKRDALITQIKNRVSTLATIQQGVQNQAHSTLTKLMMQGVPPTDVAELTSSPEGRTAWAMVSPESQRGFISWTEQNQRKAEGKPAKVNAAIVLDLGARIHLPQSDPRAIWNANQLIPFMSQGLTVEGKRSLEKELEERLTPDGRRISDVRKNTLDALLPRFYSGTIMMPDEKGKEDFLKFSEWARAKEAKLFAEGKDGYSIYQTTSKDYVGNDVDTFKRTLEQKMNDKMQQIETLGGGASLNYKGHKFPSKAALDKFKADGG